MQDQQPSGELKPHTREQIDRIYLQANLWAAHSRAAREYESALLDMGISIPHDPPAPSPTFLERLRPVAVTAFLAGIAVFLYGWGVL